MCTPAFSGTYASQFAVSGLSAVHGAAQKLKAEMKRLGAVRARDKSKMTSSLASGQQGPELRSKTNGKSINYWGLANIVNVNSAVLPAETVRGHAELPLHLASAVQSAGHK